MQLTSPVVVRHARTKHCLLAVITHIAKYQYSICDIFLTKRFLFNETPCDTQREVGIIGDGPHGVAVRPVVEHLHESPIVVGDRFCGMELYGTAQGIPAGETQEHASGSI